MVKKILQEYAHNVQSQNKIILETREEDALWFEGLGGTFKTKEAVMKCRSAARIRKYYYQVKECVLKKVWTLPVVYC